MLAQQVSVEGEDFIGLFGFGCDRYVVVAWNFPVDEVLGVPTLKTRVYGTGLIGMFCAGNSHGILFPYFTSGRELAAFRGFLEPLDVNIGVVEDKYTALGNLIAANDHGAVVSPKIKGLKLIKDVLDVEVVKRQVGGHDEAGACLLATNQGFLAHPDAESELGDLYDVLKVQGLVGSVNYGFPFVKSGVIANSNGYLAGQRTSGVELGRIEEAFGFLD